MNSKYELLYGNTNKILKIKAQKGECYIVEAGAMVSMSDVFKIRSKTGGLKKTIGRLFSGENLLVQRFIAEGQGELLLAPEYLGDIEIIDMDGTKNYRLGQSSFLAATSDIEINKKSGKINGLLSGEGVIQIEASGEGTLFISAYGAIHKKFLSSDEEYIVDTNHLVLWDSRMEYTIKTASGLLTSIAGGEGIVCKFKGPGEVWIQTRNPIGMLQNRQDY